MADGGGQFPRLDVLLDGDPLAGLLASPHDDALQRLWAAAWAREELIRGKPRWRVQKALDDALAREKSATDGDAPPE